MNILTVTRIRKLDVSLMYYSIILVFSCLSLEVIQQGVSLIVDYVYLLFYFFTAIQKALLHSQTADRLHIYLGFFQRWKEIRDKRRNLFGLGCRSRQGLFVLTKTFPVCFKCFRCIFMCISDLKKKVWDGSAKIALLSV